ncbi:hypothetical protein DYB37_009392 [Aphanomyces astaci]|uniref:Uncharacterized protein n=1 Tax=Aphanomyces astaci TaxID=112090 RepID=A0A418E665_APHAT|nr:hypothetical protein DYB35_007915 [Aphanomyces astaci]RHZ06478.1 hypothetical protein DYB37_009392 [Aphanomyces astaci]
MARQHHATWEHFYATESENLALRESVSEMQVELAQLRVWKAHAVELMTTWGPKRLKMQQEKDDTRKLKKKLIDMEQQILERVALSEMLAELKVQDSQLIDKLARTQRELELWKSKSAHECAAHVQTRSQLTFMEDTFEQLVEQLLVLRARFGSAEDANGKRALSTTEQVQPNEGESPTAYQERKLVYAAELARREHLQNDWTQEKSRLERELSRVSLALQDVEASTAKQAQDLRLLRAEGARHEQVLLAARQDVVKCTQHTLEGKTIMKRLLRDVRQYLHLTQLEVKKKFGYVPDAITHHVVWENISTSMKDFDAFLLETNNTSTPECS